MRLTIYNFVMYVSIVLAISYIYVFIDVAF